MYFCRYPSPLGNLILAEEEDAIVYCQWEDTIDEQKGLSRKKVGKFS